MIGQTYKELEIICIDDGSTDETLSILQGYEKQDNRIHIIQQQNMRAGVARNRGMQEAKGKYIIFVDSDDFLVPDAIEKLVQSAEEQQTQILVYDIYKYDNVTEKVMDIAEKTFRKSLFGDGVKKAEEITDNIFMFAGTGPWNKLYLRDFLIENHLLFPKIPRMEDLSFVLIGLTYAERIGVLDQKLYYYRMNNSFSLQGRIDETPEIFVESLVLLKRSLEERNIFLIYENGYKTLTLWLCNYIIHLLDKDSYLYLYHKYEDTFFRKLDIYSEVMEGQKQASIIMEALRAQKKVSIYGAGMLAKCIAKYLLYTDKCNCDELNIYVTSLKNNSSIVWGIPVKEIKEVTEDEKQDLFVIAVENQNIRNEIAESLNKIGVFNLAQIGYKEMLDLLVN